MKYNTQLAICLLLFSIFELTAQNISSANVDEINGLAVLELLAIGVSETESKAFSEMLRSGISQVMSENRNLKIKYKLIERSQMDRIFDQFEMQATGCTDISCAVDFGKMLSVGKIIIGSVSLVGQTYIVITRIVDVESSTILRSVIRFWQCRFSF